MCQLSPVPFHGDTIFCVEHEGQPYSPLKPIVENMGLDWKVQYRKISANKDRWGMVIMTIPSAGGEQKMLCLPLRKLAAWLASINPKKVRQELRTKIELYQAESDDALWNYWMKGKADRKIPTGAIAAKDKYEAFLEEVENLRSRTAADIETLLHKGLNLIDVGKLGPGAIIGFTPVLLDWLQSVAGRPTPIMNPREQLDRAIEYSPLYLIKHLERRLPDSKR